MTAHNVETETSRAVIEAGKKLAMGNLSNVECLLCDV